MVFPRVSMVFLGFLGCFKGLLGFFQGSFFLGFFCPSPLVIQQLPPQIF